MTIHDALESGPIVASDSECDVFLTVNGAYFNVWQGDGRGEYQNVEAYATSYDDGLYDQGFCDVWDKAKEVLASHLEPDEEE